MRLTEKWFPLLWTYMCRFMCSVVQPVVTIQRSLKRGLQNSIDILHLKGNNLEHLLSRWSID